MNVSRCRALKSRNLPTKLPSTADPSAVFPDDLLLFVSMIPECFTGVLIFRSAFHCIRVKFSTNLTKIMKELLTPIDRFKPAYTSAVIYLFLYNTVFLLITKHQISCRQISPDLTNILNLLTNGF